MMKRHTRSAVVGALRARETALRPTVWSTVHVKQGIFLLNTEPRNLVLSLVHDLLGVMTEVGLVRSAIVVVALRENQDVVTTTEGVFEDGGGAEVDIRIVSGSLVGGGTIEIPDTKRANVINLLGDSLEFLAVRTVSS